MSDYLFLMESRLSKDQLQLIVQVQHASAKAGIHLFLAGGAVRDLLAGKPIRDLDFSVEGPALKLVRQLDNRLISTLSVDELVQSAEVAFGTATAEIAMCRRETYGKTGAKPKISPATIQEDLRRRDFSVNAIALSLNKASRGLLLDPTNGLSDLERKELRALSTYSFYEDPSRLLRLIRLRTRLGYTIDERTRNHYNNARETRVEEQIPPDGRLRELEQLANELDTVEASRGLAAAGLLGVFEPHLGKKLDTASLARLDKARRVVEPAGLRVDSFDPFLWALTRKLSSSERKNLNARLGIRAARAKAWMELEAGVKPLQKLLAGKPMAQGSRVQQVLTPHDPALALFLMAFSPLQSVRERIKNYFTQMHPPAPPPAPSPAPSPSLTPSFTSR